MSDAPVLYLCRSWPTGSEIVSASCDDMLPTLPCRVDDKPRDIFGIREGDAGAVLQESGVGSSATEVDVS